MEDVKSSCRIYSFYKTIFSFPSFAIVNYIFNIKNSNTTRAWRDKALRVLDLYLVDKAADIKNSNIIRLEKILSNAYEMGDYKLALNTIDLINKTAGIYKQNETNVNIQTPDSNFKFTFGGMDMNNNTNKVEDVEIEEVN